MDLRKSLQLRSLKTRMSTPLVSDTKITVSFDIQTIIVKETDNLNLHALSLQWNVEKKYSFVERICIVSWIHHWILTSIFRCNKSSPQLLWENNNMNLHIKGANSIYICRILACKIWNGNQIIKAKVCQWNCYY